MDDDGLVDDRRIEIKFSCGDFVRIIPKRDGEEAEDIGFDVLERYDGPWQQFLEWRNDVWRRTGLCPYSGFYVATQSTWLSEVQEQRRWPWAKELRHYVLVGRDNYIEVLARGFAWREWIWLGGEREQFTNPDDVVESGQGID